ncbi:universal stress protein [Botrimarina hoheduenensis]|uniref:Universal stress protein family protein n=1 Tax=Botrimarina hoheduenensis TaxID=2528000 RepID=A0A5C5W919_9BACT|nr:universal stress protein [Botrimarina hoheduenensis]TWT47378.1 Universal stress protein family protein [Botrimarina hoheduenensis]
MIRRILLGLGGLEAQDACYTESATQMAIELALRHGASLTGVTVADLRHVQRLGPVPIGGGSAAADLRHHRVEQMHERVEAAIDHFHQACRDAAIAYEVRREERREPFDYLTSLARYHDLTVLGLRGLFEFGVEGESHYDPVSSLVRLITGGVRPMIASGETHRKIRRVLVAYSGSNESAKTMRRFAQLGLWPEATIRIAAFGPDHERRQRHLQHAASYFADHGVEVELEYQPTDPREGVLQVAHEWSADLVVMGNSNRTLMARRVLGDTMIEAIRRSDLPLFLSQ